MAFIRLEHKNISEVLAGMNQDRLLENKCFFGGGTAIVLKLDEYRLSLDIDFLCDQTDGYREIRNALVSIAPTFWMLIPAGRPLPGFWTGCALSKFIR